MKIDSHQHFWKYNAEKYSWIPDDMAKIRKDFTPTDVYPALQKFGFDGSVAVQAVQSEEETLKLLEYASCEEFIKGVVGWVDLSSAEVEKRLEVFSKASIIKGFRHTEWDKKGEFLLSPAFQNGIAALKQFDFTFDILVFDYQLPAAVELVKKFPDQPFVLDHMAKPKISEGLSEEWVKNIKQLGWHQNVYCKISGVVTETQEFQWKQDDFLPFLDTVVGTFGTSRLMFGSDWPVCLAAASYEEVVGICESYFSDFSKEEKEKVFGENATGFYNLK